MQRTLMPLALALLLGTWLLGTGCRQQSAPANAATPPAGAAEAKAEPAGHHHEHHAPHGGTLVCFGEEFAHIELVLDAEQGLLTAYVLDGEAEKAVAIADHSLAAELKMADGKTVKLTLPAVANPLTGETVGHSSQFEVRSDALRGAKQFEGTLGAVTIRGTALPATSFHFPEGSQEQEHHHEQH